MIKAIVFDFDGLTLDTETPWYDALQQLYHTYQISFPEDLYFNSIGAGYDEFDPYGYLADQLNGQPDRHTITSECKALFAAIMEKQQLREGVLDYLKEAKSLGLRIGMASSSPSAWVENYLDKYGIRQYFDCVHTADDVKEVKPNPELYLLAAKSLQADPHEAVAFEDSVNGLRAAKAAGLYCVVVPNSVTHRLPFTTHDIRLGSMSELPLLELIRQIEQRSVTGKGKGASS